MPRYKNQKVEIPKDTLYELYWDKEIDTDEIARKFDTTAETVRRRFKEHGVPYHKYDNRELFIFRHRQRSYYYDLYWGQDQTTQEIADQIGIGKTSVEQHFRDENIAIDNPHGQRWYKEGIPNKYKLPSDNPVTDIDTPLPDDPDGSKYIKEETSIQYDKYKLYKLYWGLGLSIKHIQELCDGSPKIYRQMRKFGIPIRDYYTHLKWEPYHGVPPMFEWESDEEEDYVVHEKDEPSTTMDHNGVDWSTATSHTKPQAGD